MAQMVYFALNKASRAVKIGTSNNPAKRLAELQTASPEPLELLGTIFGDSEKEEELHQRFSAKRIRGEWFRADEAMLEDIADLLGCGLDTERLVAMELIDLLDKHGKWAFSRLGPLGGEIDGLVKRAIDRVFRESGKDGMHRVFDSLVEHALDRYGPSASNLVGATLDKRFDGVGEWWS